MRTHHSPTDKPIIFLQLLMCLCCRFCDNQYARNIVTRHGSGAPVVEWAMFQPRCTGTRNTFWREEKYHSFQSFPHNRGVCLGPADSSYIIYPFFRTLGFRGIQSGLWNRSFEGLERLATELYLLSPPTESLSTLYCPAEHVRVDLTDDRGTALCTLWQS